MALGEEIWRRETSWSDTFNELKNYHDHAYRKIDEALKFDEEGQKSKALSSYNEGLVLIDKALSVNIECPTNPDFSWEKACSMVDKLRKTRKEILSRIADTQVERTEAARTRLDRPEDLSLEPPPSYEEAMATSPSSSSASNIPSIPHSSSQASPSNISSIPHSYSQGAASLPHSPLTYSELGEALNNLKVETKMQSVQIIFVVDGVRIYFISPSGTVSAPSDPAQLRILQLEADIVKALDNGYSFVDGRDTNLPQFFLQVDNWFYPLVPDVSPCFRSEYGAFILPDLQSNVEGAAVGLILPPESDSSLASFLDDLLHGIVSQPSTVSERSSSLPRTRREAFSTALSKGIVTGAHYVSTGLIKGAEKASEYMSNTTPKIISRLQPEENPRPVPDSLRTSAKMARNVTHTAVNVTGYVAGKVGSATMALGRYLAPHVQRGGTKLLSKAGVGEQAAAEGMGGVLTVAAGAVEGFGTIYTGLEQSAGILGNSLTNNTVQIVHHKYGEPLATVTGDTLYTVGNVINTTNNISNLTPKGLAKKTAKDAGKALVEPHLVKDLNLPSTSQKK